MSINSRSYAKFLKTKRQVNNSGVPQGSVLGPLLFILYINDVPDITNGICTLFGDDILIVITNYHKNINDGINNIIKKTIEWLFCNNIKSKCEK